MKVGSIVECIEDFSCSAFLVDAIPVKGEKYVVREVITCPLGVGIRVYEIVNSPHMYKDGFNEAIFNILGFREIQFPPDLQEQIEECLTREFELV